LFIFQRAMASLCYCFFFRSKIFEWFARKTNPAIYHSIFCRIREGVILIRKEISECFKYRIMLSNALNPLLRQRQ